MLFILIFIGIQKQLRLSSDYQNQMATYTDNVLQKPKSLPLSYFLICGILKADITSLMPVFTSFIYLG